MVDRDNNPLQPGPLQPGPLQPEQPLRSEVPRQPNFRPGEVPAPPEPAPPERVSAKDAMGANAERTEELLAGESDVTADAIAEPVVLDVVDLVRRFHADLYRYAYRLTGSVADAEDLTQQAYLIAQRKLHQVREAEKVKGWLYAVLRSCFLKSCRKGQPITATAADLQVDQIPQEMVEDDLFDRAELQAALDQLPDEFRLVVLMFYFEDRSYKDIATALEIPIGTVMSRLARGKGRLRKLLLDNGSPDHPGSAAQSISALAVGAPAAQVPQSQGLRGRVSQGLGVVGEPFDQDGNQPSGHAPR
jgi:RNA polymerase sigma-70 factor (ECF subfamily)